MYNYLKQKRESQLKTDQHKDVIKESKKKGKQPPKVRFVPSYTTLKVVPRSKRTSENSNSCGVALKKGKT